MNIRRNSAILLVVTTLLLYFAACGGRVSFSDLGPSELFERGKMQYDSGKYLRSIEFFQAVIFNHPGASVVDTAQYYLALSYFGQKDYTLAGIEFNRLMLNYPASAYALHSQFMKAVCFFEGTPDDYALDQSDLTTSIRQFEDFIIDHPESEVIPDVQAYLAKARERLALKYYKAGIVYLRINVIKSARIYFQKVIDDFTESPYAAMATFHIAEGAYKKHEYDEAARLFGNFSIVFSQHEWVELARARESESLFFSAKDLFDKEELEAAQIKFEEFKRRFPSSSKLNDVEKFLNILKDKLPVVSSQSDSDGS